jgi:hypothetical protein
MARDAARKNSQSAAAQAEFEAKSTAALNRTFARLKTAVDDYQASCEKIIPHALAFSSFQSKEEVTARRDEVATLTGKKDSLEQTLGISATLLREELAREGLPPKEIDRAVVALTASLDTQKARLSATMASEGRLLFSLTELLHLLENKWGHWQYDPASGQLRFKDPATLEQFNQLSTDILSEATTRAQMQQ